MAATVAVAWSCELRPVTNSIVDARWSVPVPADLAAASPQATATYYHRSEGPGRDSEWYDDLRVKRAGWPFLALRGVDGPLPTRGYLPSTIFLPDSKYVPAFARGHLLPLGPILPGFAVDTLIYGAAAWVALAVLAGLGATVRKFRGRCPGCGYPRAAGALRCPECGHLARAQSKSPGS